MFNKSTLWFHKVNDTNWGIDSYVKIVDIVNDDDFLYTYKRINNFTSGMFFLMKDGIKPVYEDEHNAKGGIFTFKISKKVSKSFWLELSNMFIKDELVKDKKHSKLLNGISISPKINNCILKIWTSKYDGVSINILRNNIDNLYLDEGMFRKNSDNK